MNINPIHDVNPKDLPPKPAEVIKWWQLILLITILVFIYKIIIVLF